MCQQFPYLIILFGVASNARIRGSDTTIANNELGFQVAFSKSWTVDGEDIEKRRDITAQQSGRTYGTAARGTSPLAVGAEGSALIIVRVLDAKKGAGLKDFVVRQNLQNFKYDEKNELKLGDILAFREIVEDSLTKLQYTYYYGVSGNHGYIMTIAIYKSDYSKYAKEIDKTVASFKILLTE